MSYVHSRTQPQSANRAIDRARKGQDIYRHLGCRAIRILSRRRPRPVHWFPHPISCPKEPLWSVRRRPPTFASLTGSDAASSRRSVSAIWLLAAAGWLAVELVRRLAFWADCTWRPPSACRYRRGRARPPGLGATCLARSFFYEGLRAARRARFFFLRWLYAVGLLLLLLWVHWLWSMESARTAVADQAYKQQAKLAQEFFYAFAIVQFAVVVLLTPAYVAGGIAEEKERRTLEFLLATDLRGREIVFGKLLARLGNLALFVMTGLPVLSMMQFFGGIDPGLLLASFAVTALTAGSLAALGILMSVQRRRARDAIILTYLAAVGYVADRQPVLAIPPLLAEYRGLNSPGPARGVGAGRRPVRRAMDQGLGRMAQLRQPVLWPRPGRHRLRRPADPVGDVVEECVERYALFHGVVHGRLASAWRSSACGRWRWRRPAPATKKSFGSRSSGDAAGRSARLADALEGDAGRGRTAVRLDGSHPRRARGRHQLHSRSSSSST